MMNGNKLRALSLCGSGLVAAAFTLMSSPAAAAEAADEPSTQEQGLGTHQKNVRLDIGFRTQFFKQAAFDPFSEHDAFHQLSLAASWGFWAHERLSLAGVVGFDYGSSSANLRSDDASLDVRRFLLAPEARYHVLPVLALTAKVGPTLTREKAVVSGGLGTDLAKTAWRFGFDATAGVAFELWGYANVSSPKPRLWLTAEGGYGWTAANRLKLEPNHEGQGPQRLTPLDLGDLSLGGPLFRITAALSFW
ncbi:MAG TPA: hypothetical protein VEQ58_14000 [Polyangiaceae bacterium]|nr:hypothetical protein [Polyangiaceae bacterium]